MHRRTLFKAGLATGTALMIPAADVQANQSVMERAREIERICRETMPAGAELKGFQFIVRGDVFDAESVWATCQMENLNLCHLRPAVFTGWRESKLTLGGV